MPEMPAMQDDLIFEVDFNNIHTDGRLVKGSLRRASHARVPATGERVLLHDGEGNECWALVDGIRGSIVYFELDAQTWTSGSDVQVEGLIAATQPYALA